METHSFTLVLENNLPEDGYDEAISEMAEKLYEAGCDDALFGSYSGELCLDFAREGGSFSMALQSALQDIDSAGYKVICVRPLEN